MAKSNTNFFVEVPVDIYGFRVVAFLGDGKSFRSMTESLFVSKQEWIETLANVEDIGGFCVGMQDAKGAFELVYINSDVDSKSRDEVIWHESLHATLDILCGLGAHVTLHEQEPAAYLQGHIATKIIELFKSASKMTQEEREKLSQTVSDASKRSETKSCRSKVVGRVSVRSRAHKLNLSHLRRN